LLVHAYISWDKLPSCGQPWTDMFRVWRCSCRTGRR
jgi:hypothetical protein